MNKAGSGVAPTLEHKCKQQLGEQLPGSLEAIRRAVSKFMKKDITTSELFDLMKAGKLLAKDILPLLGKEFADMARQGGALKYALNSLNSVQGRLNKSFKDWVYSIYQGGLLDGLRDLYKTLDQLFYYMSQGADSAIGKFLKGFLGQLENSIVFIYNNMLDLYYMLKYDFGFAGADMELLGKATYWIAVVGSLNAVVKLMRIIFGGAMLGAIAKTAAALTGFGGAAAGAATVAGGSVAATAAATTQLGLWFTTLGQQLAAIAGPLALIAGAIAGTWWTQKKYDEMSPRQKTNYQFKTTMAGTSAGGPNSSLQLPNTNPYSQMQQAAAMIQYQQQMAQVNRNDTPIKLEVKVNDSLFAKAIDIGFQDNMGKVLNSMLPPSLLIK